MLEFGCDVGKLYKPIANLVWTSVWLNIALLSILLDTTKITCISLKMEILLLLYKYVWRIKI